MRSVVHGVAFANVCAFGLWGLCWCEQGGTATQRAAVLAAFDALAAAAAAAEAGT